MQKKMDKAIDMLEEGCRTNPRSPSLFSGLIQFYIFQKNFDTAAAACKERIQKNPEDAFSCNLLGKVYGAQKKYPEAESAFQKAVDLQPLWPEPNNNLAKLYLIQGKRKEAVEKFESALQANPKNPAAYLSLGNIYQQTGENDKAVIIYERALESDPNLWVAANNLAVLLSEDSDSHKDLEKALALAKKAHTLRFGEPTVQDTLGWVYFKMGEMNQALSLLEDALSNAPENPIFNYHVGMALYKSGRPDEAREKLAKAVESSDAFLGREEAEAVLKELL
jgi:Flp pilus assembly protein TadD